jgi:hypothetical protein
MEGSILLGSKPRFLVFLVTQIIKQHGHLEIEKLETAYHADYSPYIEWH